MSFPQTVLGPVASSGLTWLSRRRLPQTSGSMCLQGLQGPVEVIRDHWGVPHIYAGNTQDAIFAQGVVHAQDRLWQMDSLRRLTSGRLAEVLGEGGLAVDRWMRILGLRRVAEQEVALLPPEIRPNFDAYTAGVNAVIARGPLPVEFALLRYRPEPWRPADILVLTKLMAWTLSVNWESEILRAQLIARLGPERAAELEPDGVEGPCILSPGVDYADIGRQAQRWLAEARPLVGPPAQKGLGSNAWVIGGTRTASGAPLVANDMHQQMAAPSIWYENHLEGGDLQVSGCIFVGGIGVISGHNGRVAWAMSNGFPDVQDLYIERLRRADDGRIQYEYQGDWHDAQVIRETIGVRWKKPVLEDVIVTRHGPIINALAPDFAGDEPLALRWTSHEPETMAQAEHEMNRARNCQEFRQALHLWTTPAQNIVYADTEGNIGYSFPGRLPIRARGDGRVPVPGWTGEYEWTGYVPFDELPHLYNPAQGYIASANNRVAGNGDYPYYIGCDFCSGDRAQRICELIEAGQRIDVPYVQRMQMDEVAPGARVVAGYLGRLEVDDPALAAAVVRMRSWDGRISAGSPEATIHRTFVLQLMQLALAGKLGDLTARYMGQGPNPVLADASLLGFRAWEWLQKVLADPRSPWFDLGGGETRDDLMRQALRQTMDYLQGRLGPNIDDWAWGRLHRLTFSHSLSRVRLLEGCFSRGPYPVGSDYMTICAIGPTQHPEANGAAAIGPNFRYVADLSDLRKSVAALVPGQSGQPGSLHYDDQIASWFRGECHPMLFAREDVERKAEARLLLVPTVRESAPLAR